MDYRGLMRRLAAAKQRSETGRINLHIRQDEIDSLLASLKQLRASAERTRLLAPRLHEEIDKLHEITTQLREENRQMRQFFYREQQVLFESVKYEGLDDWQQNVMRERDARETTRGRV